MHWTDMAARALGAPGRALARAWTAAIAAAPLRQWWQAGAAMALTVFAAGVVLILWLGPWSLAVEKTRVDGLVMICLAVLFIVLVSIVAMNDLNLNLRAGRGGVEASVVGEEHEPAPLATVTTTTTVAAPPPPAAGDGELPPGERVKP